MADKTSYIQAARSFPLFCLKYKGILLLCQSLYLMRQAGSLLLYKR